MEDARNWAGVANEKWSRIAEALGDPEAGSLLLLASIDDRVWVAVPDSVGCRLYARVRQRFHKGFHREFYNGSTRDSTRYSIGDSTRYSIMIPQGCLRDSPGVPQGTP